MAGKAYIGTASPVPIYEDVEITSVVEEIS